MRSFGNGGKVVGCGSRYAVEGIKFRLEELKITELTGLSQATRDALLELMTKSDIASLSKLRNWLAHLCFGTEELIGFLRDPFARTSGRSPSTYGAIDALRSKGQLTDCDVPLALLYWIPSGVQFLDMWSVRRRPIVPSIDLRPFAPRSDYPHIALAMIMQFQQHIDDLVRQGGPAGILSAIRATNFFRYLPPCGAFPIVVPGKPAGFVLVILLNGLAYRDPVYIEGAVLEPLLREALSYPPLDLHSDEFFWLYQVRDNAEAIASNTADPVCTVFAGGHLSYRGDARFNLARWDYSNIASLPIF
jgi:hypothetical protein